MGVALNPSVAYELDLNMGVGQSTIDLSKLTVTGGRLDAGVGTTDLMPPAKGRFTLNIDGGVGTIRIHAPGKGRCAWKWTLALDRSIRAGGCVRSAAIRMRPKGSFRRECDYAPRESAQQRHDSEQSQAKHKQRGRFELACFVVIDLVAAPAAGKVNSRSRKITMRRPS
ncbi:MAG: hypothetical protein U0559_05225 [Anaerolineae bacterium]